MERQTARVSNAGEQDFYEQLFRASVNERKYAPLWKESSDNRGSGGIRIRTLQHMNIINLRKLIADEVAIMARAQRTDQDQMRLVEDLMNRYVSALRDLKFFLEKPSDNDRVANFLKNLTYINARDDPAILFSSGIVEPGPIKRTEYLKVPDFTGHYGYRSSQDFSRQRFDRFIRRLLTALFGGLALIAPMLIMRLHPDLLTQLLTASLFILAFGCILAFFLDHADETYIASLSAAYAAVLVVFVGASSGG